VAAFLEELVKVTQKDIFFNSPATVVMTQIIILVVGIVWIGFSFFMAFFPNPSFAGLGAYRWLMAVMTFFAGASLIVLCVLLHNRWEPAWYLTVVAMSLMIVAFIFDQVGWVDVLLMLGSAIPLVLLIIDRKWYLKASV
jgi:hypothetical protein